MSCDQQVKTSTCSTGYFIQRIFRDLVLGSVFVFSFVVTYPSWTGTVPVAFAADVTTSFSSRFEIDNHAKTRVSHLVTLTNKRADLFVSEYSLTLGSTNVRDVRAFDEQGNLPVSRTGSDRTTTLTIDLESRPAIGVGTSKRFTVDYANDDIATAVGHVLEVNIPRITNAGEFDVYDVTLVVPSSFGKPSNIIPEPSSTRQEKDGYIISFHGSADHGISAVFGSSQTYSLDLRYFLENPDGKNASQSITLIPDTPYQRVFYKDLTPKPVSINRDGDGNWIATYEIPSGQSISIQLTALVSVFMDAVTPVSTEKPEQFLSPTAYWESDDPEIHALATKLKTPKQIYDFVVKKLQYNYTRIEPGNKRLGAKDSLTNPDQAICTEFTDLFIALARAAGIPARELNGFAFTENQKLRPLSLTKDILHAWPEYWDSDTSQWVQVDPTWGDTTGGIDYFSKLDFSHIVFAIHGSSPVSPLPAGFFKPRDSQEKTVFVSPSAERAPDPDSSILGLKLVMPKEIPLFFTSTLALEVTNPGPSALYRLPMQATLPYQVVTPLPKEVDVILPFQTLSFPLVVKPVKSPWKKTLHDITITIGDQREQFSTVSAPPFPLQQALALVGIIVALLAVGVAIRSRHLSLRRQKR